MGKVMLPEGWYTIKQLKAVIETMEILDARAKESLGVKQ